MSNQVVAHFLNGTMVKGTSMDVDPLRPLCHIRTLDKGVVEVKLAELKSLYFVKDLVGKSTHKESKVPEEADTRLRGAHGIQLKFLDGEHLVGVTHQFPPRKAFFFVIPVDPQSNNSRILVNRAAVKEVLGEDGKPVP